MTRGEHGVGDRRGTRVAPGRCRPISVVEAPSRMIDAGGRRPADRDHPGPGRWPPPQESTSTRVMRHARPSGHHGLVRARRAASGNVRDPRCRRSCRSFTSDFPANMWRLRNRNFSLRAEGCHSPGNGQVAGADEPATVACHPCRRGRRVPPGGADRRPCGPKIGQSVAIRCLRCPRIRRPDRDSRRAITRLSRSTDAAAGPQCAHRCPSQARVAVDPGHAFDVRNVQQRSNGVEGQPIATTGPPG